MRHVHFCAGLQQWNGMANLARMLVKEQTASGDESVLTNLLIDLKRQLERGADEVCIHGAWLPVLWRAAKVTKRAGARLVFMPHGSYDPVRRRYHGWKKLLVSQFERSVARRADRIVATCEAEKGWIENYLGKHCPPVEVTDVKRFFRLPQNDKTGQTHFIISKSSRPLHLLYLGRRHPLKGVKYLEEAVRLMLTQRRGGAECAEIELRVVSSAFGEEKDKVWKWCDVLVLPTLSENFGLVVAEALERGKRVIATDGAPAWGNGLAGLPGFTGLYSGYCGQLIYLKGYRDGTAAARVRLLAEAISSLANSER